MKLTFYKDKDTSWRWQLKSSNGEIVGASSEGFYSRYGAKRNFKLFIKSITEIK